MQASLTKEQLMEIMVESIHTKKYRVKEKKKKQCVNLKLIDNVTIDWDDLVKCYKEKFNEDLKGKISPRIEFEYCVFHNCTFINLKLDHCIFIHCDILKPEFKSCNLDNTQFTQSSFGDAFISNCSIVDSHFVLTEFFDSHIFNTKLEDSYFLATIMHNINFSKTDLMYSRFHFTQISNSTFYNCILKNIGIQQSLLSGSKLTGTTKFDSSSEIERLSITDCNPDIPPVKNHFISISNIGSRLDNLYYDYENDRVICGCWREDLKHNYHGGTLKNFEKSINMVYPEGRFHDEYLNAIEIFRVVREKYLKSFESQK